MQEAGGGGVVPGPSRPATGGSPGAGPRGLDLPRAAAGTPSGTPGGQGRGLQLRDRPPSFLRETHRLEGAGQLGFFFFQLKLRPAAARNRRSAAPAPHLSPQHAAPLCWGRHFLLRTPPTPEIPRVFLLAPKARGLRERLRVSGGQLAPSQAPSFPVYRRFGELAESKPRGFRNGTGPRFGTSSEAGRRLRSQKRPVSWSRPGGRGQLSVCLGSSEAGFWG